MCIFYKVIGFLISSLSGGFKQTLAQLSPTLYSLAHSSVSASDYLFLTLSSTDKDIVT